MNKNLEQIISIAGDLPTIPVVATKIMQLMESETTTADDLARVISSDPAIAARVLKISNSSFYGAQRMIKTLPHAIMMLGMLTLKSVVVAASIKQIYQPYGLTEKLLWEHSYGTGLMARMIAMMMQRVNPDEAFLGGLFHDIGKQLMNHLEEEKFSEVMQHCYNDGTPFYKMEHELFKYGHAEAGAMVIKKWNFPEHLVRAVEMHHDQELPEDEDPYTLMLARIVRLANLFSHYNGIGTVSANTAIDLARSGPAVHLELGDDQIKLLQKQFMEAFARDKAFFA